MSPLRRKPVIILLALLVATALAPAHAHALTFTDVPDDAWYAHVVDWASDSGYITGYGDGSTFGPDDPLQRGQAATILWRFAGSPEGAESSGKADVDQDEYYASGVDWAIANGVMSGYGDGSNRFGPLDSLTREQLASVIGHMAGVSVEEAAATDDAEFQALADHDGTSDWAQPYVVWATHNHIINGVGGRYLQPQATITRAQMAAILFNSVNAGILQVDTSSPYANSYAVTFDANNGTGISNKMHYSVGQQMNLPFNYFTRDGYTFVGWNTAADGSGTSYRDGQSVTDLVPAGGGVVLYAQWRQGIRLNDAYAVLYSDGEVVIQQDDEVDVGTTDRTVIAQGRGYQLAGSSDFALQCRLRATKLTSTCDIYVNASTLSSFAGWQRLSDISGLARWDVSNVTNLSNLFSGCASLEDLSPIAGWDVSNVTRMGGTFRDCTALTTLEPLAGWDVSSALDMGGIFRGCAGVADLSPLASWNTHNAIDLSYAFAGCSSLRSAAALARWDVSSVLDLGHLFDGCSAIADFSALDGWQLPEGAITTDAFADTQAAAARPPAYPSWYTTSTTTTTSQS